MAGTLVTSVVGALTFAALALVTPGAVTPEWVLGLVCGLGGARRRLCRSSTQPAAAGASPHPVARCDRNRHGRLIRGAYMATATCDYPDPTRGQRMPWQTTGLIEIDTPPMG